MHGNRSSVLPAILDYVELDDGDRARLAALHETLAPHFHGIAERFYARANAAPETAALLTGTPPIERLIVTLVDWMSSGLLGPYDEQFYDKRSRIGRKHVEIGLPQHYMFTAMNGLRNEYEELIFQSYETAEARAAARAVNKLLDVELALMLRHYQLDSEARLVERELRVQRDRVLALQTLSAGLAHEFRNPLNSAKLQLELLERRAGRDGADSTHREPIAAARSEIERLTKLLTEFVSFARPTELALGDHDVTTIARSVVAQELRPAAPRNVTIELSVDRPVVARVDAAKFQQIVQHLVRNAVEAVDTGGQVTVAIERGEDRLVLDVEDDGPGIPDAVRARIFEPFFTTKSNGTGLGMAVVHTMVALHAGTITIDSAPRRTRCRVTLPQPVRA
ncbi:MAG TPA: protoglobin domain-containing protein [Kofleriaceae bacterium]|nr:protoglobin domain-containing protein [Kofleriaceae bacterium]